MRKLKKPAKSVDRSKHDTGENRRPVRSGNDNFSRTAEKTHGMNRYTPMRGGIRL